MSCICREKPTRALDEFRAMSGWGGGPDGAPPTAVATPSAPPASSPQDRATAGCATKCFESLKRLFGCANSTPATGSSPSAGYAQPVAVAAPFPYALPVAPEYAPRPLASRQPCCVINCCLITGSNAGPALPPGAVPLASYPDVKLPAGAVPQAALPSAPLADKPSDIL